MIERCILWCTEKGIDWLFASGEADPQLAQLLKSKQIVLIISDDLDFLLYCHGILLLARMSDSGYGTLYRLSETANLPALRTLFSLFTTDYSEHMHMLGPKQGYRLAKFANFDWPTVLYTGTALAHFSVCSLSFSLFLSLSLSLSFSLFSFSLSLSFLSFLFLSPSRM